MLCPALPTWYSPAGSHTAAASPVALAAGVRSGRATTAQSTLTGLAPAVGADPDASSTTRVRPEPAACASRGGGSDMTATAKLTLVLPLAPLPPPAAPTALTAPITKLRAAVALPPAVSYTISAAT